MKFFSKTFGVFEITLIVILIVIYYYFTFVIVTDIAHHAQFIKDYADGKIAIQTNFLYYFTVYLLSFFSSDISVLLVISVYVLAFITFFKFIIVKKIIQIELSNSYKNIEVISSLTSLLLLFLFSLPSILILKGKLYTLSFPPNIWHNSTTIFVMPFVVLLFWISLKQLSDFKVNRLMFITILIVLNVLVKPSFVFVYIFAYPILLFKKHLFSKLFWINLTPIVVAFLLIVAEYYFIYVESPTDDKSSVAINFFYLINTKFANGDWLYLMAILASTIVSSFLFPIIFLIKNKKVFKEDMIQFAIICIVIAILIGNILYETGNRSWHGNLFWQNIMCSFLLFFVCILQLFKLIANNPKGWKAFRIEIGALTLHLLSAFFYFFKIFITSSYS